MGGNPMDHADWVRSELAKEVAKNGETMTPRQIDILVRKGA